MLFFDHLSVNIGFFKLKLFQVRFICLISSSQNFVTFSSKTDKVIKKFFSQILKSSQLWRILLNISCINFQSKWNLIFLYKHRLPDRGRSNHWQSYVNTVHSKFHHKYQIILQLNQICVIIPRNLLEKNYSMFDTLEKSKKSKIKHQFSQNIFRYIFLLIRVDLKNHS